MKDYRLQCVVQGQLLGKFFFYLDPINGTHMTCLLEAEEAQAKIEELRDQAYTESRTALLSKNDSEMSDLIQ
jgi:hypothetical protein